jgi:hypothetical protein
MDPKLNLAGIDQTSPRLSFPDPGSPRHDYIMENSKKYRIMIDTIHQTQR